MSASDPDLDMGRLARLGAFDEPAIARIIVHFLETLDERIAAMAAAAAAGDTGALIHQAHQLRGSAANCGFCGLATACSALVSAPSGFDALAFRTLAGRARRAWQDARGH
jgi:HPt (histidine-containing phosphotransfer) domain-containing protein